MKFVCLYCLLLWLFAHVFRKLYYIFIVYKYRILFIYHFVSGSLEFARQIPINYLGTTFYRVLRPSAIAILVLTLDNVSDQLIGRLTLTF